MRAEGAFTHSLPDPSDLRGEPFNLRVSVVLKP